MIGIKTFWVLLSFSNTSSSGNVNNWFLLTLSLCSLPLMHNSASFSLTECIRHQSQKAVTLRTWLGVNAQIPTLPSIHLWSIYYETFLVGKLSCCVFGCRRGESRFVHRKFSPWRWRNLILSVFTLCYGH